MVEVTAWLLMLIVWGGHRFAIEQMKTWSRKIVHAVRAPLCSGLQCIPRKESNSRRKSSLNAKVLRECTPSNSRVLPKAFIFLDTIPEINFAIVLRQFSRTMARFRESDCTALIAPSKGIPQCTLTSFFFILLERWALPTLMPKRHHRIRIWVASASFVCLTS